MNKYFDKLLLLLGLIILVGGVVFAVSQSGKKTNILGAIQENHLKGEPYTLIGAPDVKVTSRTWEAPQPQNDRDKNWLYGVFTPPKIYIDPVTGEVTAEPPIPPKPRPPFGLVFTTMTHPEYPIKFESYFESANGKVEDSTVMLYHKELRKSSGIKKIGADIADWGIKILKLELDKVEKIVGDSKTIENVAIITIKDRNLRKDFTLKSGETMYLKEKNILKFEFTDKSEDAFIWEKVGDTKENGSAKYTLMQIDFDKLSVTVKKEAPELENPEERVMEVTSVASPVSPESAVKPDNKSKSTSSDNSSNSAEQTLKALFK